MKPTNTERVYAVDKMLNVGGRSYATQHCQTCGGPTREGKPYCTDHVKSHDYVKGVLAVLREMETELEAVRTARRDGWKLVNVLGPKCDEIMLYLNQHGTRTVERVLREVFGGSTTVEVVEVYAEALRRAGRITMGRTTRGALSIRSTQPVVVDSVTACA